MPLPLLGLLYITCKLVIIYFGLFVFYRLFYGLLYWFLYRCRASETFILIIL